MIRRSITPRTRLILGIGSFVTLAVLYTCVSNWKYAQNPTQTTIPGWIALWEGIQKMFASQREFDGNSMLWEDSKASFARLATGLGIGCSIGVIIGIAMGCYSVIESFFLPPLTFLAKIPPTAMLAVFYALAGVNFEFFVAMIAFGVLPTLAQSIYHGVKNDVPDELINKAFTLGASQPEVIWNVIYKQVLPRIIDAIRLQVGPAMVYLIAAEWINTDIGFGYRFRALTRLSQMNVIYVYLVYLGLVGLFIDFSLTWIRKKLCPWFGE